MSSKSMIKTLERRLKYVPKFLLKTTTSTTRQQNIYFIIPVYLLLNLNMYFYKRGESKYRFYFFEHSFTISIANTKIPQFTGVPQGSILGPLLLLAFMNDLPNELKSNAKPFATDKSLFTIIKDKQESADILNHNLSLIYKWAFNWKMLFNPDPKKPAQEVLFSKKIKTQNHPNISLNNIQLEKVSPQNTYA